MAARHDHCPECGYYFGAPRRRSVQDLRRLFSIIRSAFENWPEAHEFCPESAEHLRAWLICKAGPKWRVSQPIMIGDNPRPEAIALAVEIGMRVSRESSGYGFVVVDGGRLGVVAPKSISFRAMGQSEFAEIRDAIEDVVKGEMGT